MVVSVVVVVVDVEEIGLRLLKNLDFCNSAALVDGVSDVLGRNLEKCLLVDDVLLLSVSIFDLTLFNCLEFGSNTFSVVVLINLLPAALVFSVSLTPGLANLFTYLFWRNFFSVVVSNILSAAPSFVRSVVAVLFSGVPIGLRRIGRKCAWPPNLPLSIDFGVGSSGAIVVFTVVDETVVNGIDEVYVVIGWVTGPVFLCSIKKFETFLTRIRCLSVAASYIDVITLVIVDVGAFVALSVELTFLAFGSFGASVVLRASVFFSVVRAIIVVLSFPFLAVDVGTFTVDAVISVNGSVPNKMVLITLASVVKAS